MGLAWLFGLAAVSGCLLTFAIWRLAEARVLRGEPGPLVLQHRRLAVGAGWAIVVSVLLLWPWTNSLPGSQIAFFLLVVLVLAAVSWVDDLHPLPPLWRLVV